MTYLACHASHTCQPCRECFASKRAVAFPVVLQFGRYEACYGGLVVLSSYLPLCRAGRVFYLSGTLHRIFVGLVVLYETRMCWGMPQA